MPSALSKRYATALADALRESRGAGAPQAIAAQLGAFSQLLSGSHELRTLFATPAVNAERKKAVLEKLAPLAGLDPLAVNFLKVVIDHERTDLLNEIVEAFEAILHERLSIALADITTARPLGEAEKNTLAQALSAKTGKNIEMKFALDPALIGGVVARIGSTVYDGSVRGYLDRLHAELTGE